MAPATDSADGLPSASQSSVLTAPAPVRAPHAAAAVPDMTTPGARGPAATSPATPSQPTPAEPGRPVPAEAGRPVAAEASRPVPADRSIASDRPIARSSIPTDAATTPAPVGTDASQELPPSEGTGAAATATAAPATPNSDPMLAAVATATMPGRAAVGATVRSPAVTAPTTTPAPAPAPASSTPTVPNIAPAVPAPVVVEAGQPAGDLAAPTGPGAEAVATTAAPTAPATPAPAPAPAPGPLAQSVAARVETAVEALRNAPPPREAVIDVDGLRVTVRLLGEQVQVAVDQPTAPRMARELADALASRGLQLQGSGAEGHGDGTDAQPLTQAGPDALATMPAAEQ